MSAKGIPGLSFLPLDDEEEGEGIQIQTFTGIMRVPESHRYGGCRRRDDFVKLATIYDGNFGTVCSGVARRGRGGQPAPGTKLQRGPSLTEYICTKKIYKCRDKKNGETYALKKFIFTPEMLKDGIPKSFLREINVLQVLKHENIVNSHGMIAGKKLESNFLLLDYCTTSLQELIEKRCEAIYQRDVVKYLMKQLFDGLNYMHQSLIIHRNISCQNLLFNEYGTLKISGFRTARFYDKEGMSPAITELAYRAPELLFKVDSYGSPADIWSAGCVFARLLLKRPLFSGDSELAVLSSIFGVLGTPSENIWPGFDNIIRKGKVNQKIITNPQSYSDIKNTLAGVPDSSSKLLQDLIIYYPLARLEGSEVLKSPYMTEAPAECSSAKMVSILNKSLSVSQLLDVPLQLDN